MKKFFSVLLIAILVVVSNSAFSQVTTIPAGASPYANLGAAFTAINAGGPYTGVAVTVTITADLVEAASATLNGGVFTSCLIRPSGVRTVTGNFNASVISLDGADNVTIDGLNSGGNSLELINPNAGTNSNGIQGINGATFNTFRNVKVTGLGAIAGTNGGRGFNWGQSIAGSGGNNDNLIENCSVNGFRRGIQNFGTDGNGVIGFYNERNIFRNNSIKNSTALYIFIGTASADNTIEGNTFFSDAAVPNDAQTRVIAIQGQGYNISEIIKFVT